jgi:hypothetical protein
MSTAAYEACGGQTRAVHEREPAPQQLEEWEREAGAGRAEAAATLAAWYRRLELGPEELGGVVGRDASPDEARWTERAVELGGFPYAWRAWTGSPVWSS